MRAVPSLRRRLVELLPTEETPPLVEYKRGLIGFVGVVGLCAVCLALVTVRPAVDPLTVTLGGLVLAAGAFCSVRVTQGVDSVWTSGLFLHMALAFTFGPLGALVAAGAQAIAQSARLKSGWFRAFFNSANFFLSDMSAWATFSQVGQLNRGIAWNAVAATLAGATSCVVNHALLSAVIWFASGRRASAWTVFRRTVSSLILYNVGYGWAAYGAVLLFRVGGAAAFSTSLLPVILLQGFLVLLAKRIKAQEQEREEHSREREALLQQAIDASEVERKRIASDLHDGVVQTLAGLALSLAARGSSNGRDPQLLDDAGTIRNAVTDLRTLMIEIAPPDLATTGVDTALRKLLEPLPSRGIEVELVARPAQLAPDKTSLVFRVAQEAVRNVVNHSQATRVTARLQCDDELVKLEVVDNGKGFSQDDRSRRRDEGHVGLHLLNNAVEASEGRLTLTSEPGRGTTLMLELPC